MAGLIGDSEGGERASTTGGNTAFTTTDAGTGQSHLDSFFQASGWTRDDVMLLAVLLQAVILIAWFVEVRDA